jgi:hypothetical protein
MEGEEEKGEGRRREHVEMRHLEHRPCNARMGKKKRRSMGP